MHLLISRCRVCRYFEILCIISSIWSSDSNWSELTTLEIYSRVNRLVKLNCQLLSQLLKDSWAWPKFIHSEAFFKSFCSCLTSKLCSELRAENKLHVWSTKLIAYSWVLTESSFLKFLPSNIRLIDSMLNLIKSIKICNQSLLSVVLLVNKFRLVGKSKTNL